jgi:hypothetical protein
VAPVQPRWLLVYDRAHAAFAGFYRLAEEPASSRPLRLSTDDHRRDSCLVEQAVKTGVRTVRLSGAASRATFWPERCRRAPSGRVAGPGSTERPGQRWRISTARWRRGRPDAPSPERRMTHVSWHSRPGDPPRCGGRSVWAPSISGVRSACLEYVPGVRLGEYVIVHVGFAISRVDERRRPSAPGRLAGDGRRRRRRTRRAVAHPAVGTSRSG